MTSGQDAYRLGDGAPVGIESARAIWTAVAREVLEEHPGTGFVAHSDLARQVQQRSGVYTRLPAADWLAAVVADLGDAELIGRVRADSPRLSSATRRASVAKPRAEPRAPKRHEAPPAICPTCFMQLPASGRCDTCG